MGYSCFTVLVSAVQWSELALSTHIPPPSWASAPPPVIAFKWDNTYVSPEHRALCICGSAGKESACNVGDLGLIPGLGRSPGEGKGYPLQYSGLENSIDCIVHGVAKNRTWLSGFHFTSLHFTSNNRWAKILCLKLQSTSRLNSCIFWQQERACHLQTPWAWSLLLCFISEAQGWGISHLILKLLLSKSIAIFKLVNQLKGI